MRRKTHQGRQKHGYEWQKSSIPTTKPNTTPKKRRQTKVKSRTEAKVTCYNYNKKDHYTKDCTKR